MNKIATLAAAVVLSSALPSICAQGAAIPMPGDFSTGSAGVDSNVKLPEFEVASIRPHPGDDHMISFRTTQDGFTFNNVTLQMLISNAYGIKSDLISGGPGWIGTTPFDFNAKVAGSDVDVMKKLSSKQRQAMLIPVLNDRFHLKTHIETKTLPIYELTLAKGGPLMKEAASAPPPSPDAKPGGSLTPSSLSPNAKPGDVPKGAMRITMGNGIFNGQSLPIASLISQLSSILHRTVVDKTGLTGKYDFDLKYTPEQALGPGGTPSDSGTDAAPSIFTAVQEQLGLKLVSAKGPVDTLVIDHAEMPSEN